MLWIAVLLTLVPLVIVTIYVLHKRKAVYERFQERANIPKEIMSKLELEPFSSSWETDTVPLLLHQTAPADKSKWHVLWKPCQESWIKKLPHFTYCMWNDQDIVALIQKRYPKFLPIFHAYDHDIKRIDAFRYFLLYEYGGVYVDMDYECVRKFDHALAKGKVSIAESMFEGERYQNAFMASPPRHPFWLYMFEVLLKNKDDQVVFATGPKAIDEAAALAPAEMYNSLPKDRFSVIEPFESSLNSQRTVLNKDWEAHPKVYAAHHCTGTWFK